MNEAQLRALRAGAVDGIAFDGLRVGESDDGYVFETPGESHRGLTAGELQAVARRKDAFVTNWYYWRHADGVRDVDDAERAFLRWLERADDRGVERRYGDLADGITREWGELAITARLDSGGDEGDGIRRYDLRHAADVGEELSALETRTDPREAREIAKFDERGRYRPLKTATTLRPGWVYPDLDGVGLVRAVDFLYPATVHNWHLERSGDLDVTHWRETADRQTGIYADVGELPDEALEWAVEACCADAACVKRREWDVDDATPVNVDRGDGEFPCREPCSLFVAGARKWLELEREETRTYEFELAPSERAQLEALVDAVADGRVDDVREGDFDDAANRYRARYLRAKRLDDENRFPTGGGDCPRGGHDGRAKRDGPDAGG